MTSVSTRGRRPPSLTLQLSLLPRRALLLLLLVVLVLGTVAAEVEELPKPEALSSYPVPNYSSYPDLYPDLRPEADGGSLQTSYNSYQPRQSSYQSPSYGYESSSCSCPPAAHGYSEKDDCSSLERLGILAGGTALATVIGSLLLNGTIGRSFGRELDHFEVEVGLAFGGPPLELDVADATVNVTCQLAGWIAGEDAAGSVHARDSGQISSSDCFSGMIGAIAGFAAIGALIAYALYQASLAKMMSTGRRDLGGLDGLEIDQQGVSLMAEMALLFLQRDDSAACLPHGLCRLNQRSRSISPFHYLATKLASLPAGWFLGSRMSAGGVRSSSDRSFLDMCRGITITGSQSACDRQYPGCTGVGW